MKPVTTTGRWRVPWIEALPDGWEFLSAKRLFQPRPELASVDEPQLAATQAFGVIEQAEYERRVGRKVTKLNKNLDKRRLVKRDDFIISMRSFEGGLERAWAEGGIRSSYIVLKPAAEISVGFYQHLFKSQPYIEALRATCNFIRDGQDLNYSNFSLVDLPYPPVEDQALIARYLDWHGAMTGRLIRAKRRLIALLNEQKQSIIHRAVTRGLDPAAKLKPSGVDWLGNVPAHWEVKPLKWWADINRETLGQNTPDDFAFDYIDIGSVGTGMLTASLERLTFKASPSRARRVVRLGDTIVSTVRTYLKAIWFVGEDRSDLIASTGFAVLTPKDNVSPRFFAFALQSAAFINLVISRSDGVAYPAINETRLGSLKVALPSSMAEQDAIIAHLDEATVTYDQAIAAAQSEITLIQEFRTRLIADVVTGQLDVRAAAASLPEVAENDAFTDAPDDMDDEDEGAHDVETEDA